MKRPTLIRWRDAYGVGATWIAADAKIPDPVIVTTVGWIVRYDLDGYVVIADSVFDGEDGTYYGGVNVIPAGMIIEKRKL